MSGSDRYTILEEIASGSTATVYLAEDTLLRRKVALKKLHPHLHNHAEMVSRFAKEAVAIAALSHENIIKVFEYGNQERNLFLAMEYVDGMNLDAILKGRPGLPNLAALCLFRQLLEGLAAAHARGIYHRDIKPSNVLLDRKGCVRIADFGIAFLSEETSITRTGSYLGTPGYSAPEQADGRVVSDRTDVFSTGILFYRCLTGKLPFEGETPHAVLRAIMEKEPPKAQTLNRRILPGLPEFLESMLAKEPKNRPTALECIARLEDLARKSGFFFEPARIARFLAEGEAYRTHENGIVSDHFAARARQALSRGDAREALKSYALAEIFSADPRPVRMEADALMKRLRNDSRRKMLAGALAGGAVIAAIALWRSNRPSAPPDPPPMTRALPKAAASHVIPAGTGVTRDTLRPAVPVKTALADGSTRTSKRQAVHAAGTSASAPRRGSVPPMPAARAESPNPAAAPSLPGFVIVKTTPPFARIFMDGVAVGVTPTKSPLEIKPGTHELVLEREGCLTLRSAFNVVSGETASLRFSLERSAYLPP